MPIIGMTDNVRPGFPELGRLRKGAKKTRPDRPGEDLEWFRFTTVRPEIAEAFRAVYGEQPRMINVFLPYIKAEAEFDGDEANFSAWMEEWNGAGTLLHRCDGKKVTRWYDAGAGKYRAGEGKLCPYEDEKKRTKKTPGCTQVGRLAVVIPELIEAGFVGYVLAETHAKNDIVSLLASLLQIEAECARYGGEMVGVLCRLQRLDEEITTPGWNDEEKANGKRHKTTKSLLKLSPAPEWVRAVRLEAQNRAMLVRREDPDAVLAEGRRLLHSGDEVDALTGEVTDGPDWDGVPNQGEAMAEELPPDEPSEETATELSTAMAYILDSGKKLGSVSDQELGNMLDRITALETPTEKMIETKRHVETLLNHMAKMQAASAEWAVDHDSATQEAML